MSVVSEPPRAPVVIDVEASGFGRGSYPIEVGLVLEDGTPHCFLVRPHDEWTHWDEAAAKVHKIPREALFQRGLPVTTVAERLNEILDARTVYSDGWSFDRTWLALLFEFAGRLQRFKLESVRALLNEAQAEIWHPTVDAVTTELALARQCGCEYRTTGFAAHRSERHVSGRAPPANVGTPAAIIGLQG